jgi:hypothetical protein
MLLHLTTASASGGGGGNFGLYQLLSACSNPNYLICVVHMRWWALAWAQVLAYQDVEQTALQQHTEQQQERREKGKACQKRKAQMSGSDSASAV